MQKIIKKLIKNEYLDYWVLLLLIFFIVITNIIWLKIDTNTPHWDEGRHLWTSLNYFDLVRDWFKNNLFDLSVFKSVITKYYYYPPWYYISTIPIYYLFGKSSDSAIFINILYMSVLIFSTYGIGKIIWNRATGIMASFFVALSPMIITFSREYMLDMPLTALVALSILLLLKTENFKKIGYSFLFAISCVLGLLTKWTFGVFLLGPALYSIGEVIYDYFQNWKKLDLIGSLANIILSVIVIIFLVYPWYYTNLGQIKLDFSGNASITGPEKGAFLLALNNINTYFILFIFVLIGLFYSLIKLKYFKRNFILLLSIIVSLSFLYFFTNNQNARFFLPWLVFGSILATFWIPQIKSKLSKLIAIVLLGLILSFNFITVSFGISYIPNEGILNVGSKKIVIFRQYGYTTGQPIQNDWQVGKILSDIYIDAQKENLSLPTHLSTYLDDNKRFNNWDFRYYSLLDKSKWPIEFSDFKDIYSNNYIVTRFGTIPDNLDPFKSIKSDFESLVENQKKSINFDLVSIGHYSLPYNASADLLRVDIKNDNWVMDIDKKNYFCRCEVSEGNNKKYLGIKKEDQDIVVWGQNTHLERGKYQLQISLKFSDNNITGQIASVDVFNYNPPSNKFLTNLVIMGTDFTPNKWKIFNLFFENKNSADELEFRVHNSGIIDFNISNIRVEKIN